MSQQQGNNSGATMPRVDTAALKARVDLLELASSDTQLRKVTASEYAGPCPLCGGSDRFHLDGAAGWFFCRQCHEKRGDVIEYAQWRYGLDFAGACAALGGDAPTLRGSGKAQRPAVQTPAQTAPEPPAAAWQARAEAMVSYAEGQLWQNEQALGYLRGRGLSDASIREARLGYVPKTVWGQQINWFAEDGKPINVWQGWTIPCHMAGALWYVKTRIEHPGQGGAPDAKYWAVKGSHKAGAVYGLDLLPAHAADLVLCEGELNALILRQALEPVCAVLSVGSASDGLPAGKPLQTVNDYARRVALFDQDAAGKQGQERLTAKFASVRVVSWPRDWPTHTATGSPYDVNDAWLDGLDLAAWIISSIGPTEPEARGRWARYWLDYEPLDSAAAAVTGTIEHPANLMDPKLRLWLAVYAEYGALGWPEP